MNLGICFYFLKIVFSIKFLQRTHKIYFVILQIFLKCCVLSHALTILKKNLIYCLTTHYYVKRGRSYLGQDFILLLVVSICFLLVFVLKSQAFHTKEKTANLYTFSKNYFTCPQFF